MGGPLYQPISVTFRLLDLNIDIGQVLGAVGGLLFSAQNDNTDNENTDEEVTEGELGKISFQELKLSIIYFQVNRFIAKMYTLN